MNKWLFVWGVGILAMVGFWFRQQMIIGAGESGLPFVNHGVLLPRTAYAWNDALLGNYSNQAGIIFVGLIFLLSQLGLPAYVIQASFYIAIFLLASLAVYRLAWQVKPSWPTAMASAIFYVFNPFTVVTVVNRLQYPFILFYAWLPLALCIFTLGWQKRQYRYAVYLGLASIFFSLAVAPLPFLFLFWMVLLAYSGWSVLTGESKIGFAAKYVSLTVFLWVIVNVWWLGPLLVTIFTTDFPTTGAVTAAGNYRAFLSLSRLVGGLPAVLRLVDESFMSSIGNLWGGLWGSLAFRIVALMPALAALSAMLVFNRPPRLKFFILMYLTAVFFAKGSEEPLGEISFWLMSLFRPLEVFRNSFEKIGFAVILSQSILVGFVVSKLYERLKGRWRWGLVGLFGVMMLTLGHPLLTGRVFTSSSFPNNDIGIGDYVVVPDYYRQANRWLNSQPGWFRTVGFPIGGEGMTYSWEYGYNGVELSGELFDRPIVAMTTTVPFLDGVTFTLEKALATHSAALARLWQWLNVRFVLVRQDVDYQRRQTRNPDISQQLVAALPGVTAAASFGPLTFYRLPQDPPSSLIYPSVQLVGSSPHAHFSDALLWTGASSAPVLINFWSDLPMKEILIKPVVDVILPAVATGSGVKEMVEQLPAIKHLPQSPLYPLVLFKETVNRRLVPAEGENTLRYDLNLLGKRVAEIYAAATANQSAHRAISAYHVQFADRFVNDKLRPKLLPWGFLVEQFSRQVWVLQEALLGMPSQYRPRAVELLNYVTGKLTELGLRSIYPPHPTIVNRPRRMIRFAIPQAGTYTLNLVGEGVDKPTLAFQVDDSWYQAATSSGRLASLFLERGTHELLIPVPEMSQMRVEQEQVITSGRKTILPITQFCGGCDYEMGFDYWVKRGDSFEVGLVQDNDDLSLSRPEYLRRRIVADGYNHSWNHFSMEVNTYHTATAGEIIFQAHDYNYCPTPSLSWLDKCRNFKFKAKFNKPAEVVIRNFYFQRKFTNPFFLTQQRSEFDSNLPQVKFVRHSPVKYSLEVEGATQPFMLVFSQLYDPGWRLTTAGGKPVSDQHLVVNGFANGWWIEKLPNKTVAWTLEFVPQRWLEISRAVSLAFLVLVLIKICLVNWA